MNEPIIGFIGLGIMGRPMAANLLKAGYSLVLHDLNRQSVEVLSAEFGAAQAFSPAEIAEKSEVIITMLPDSADVELVALGADGIIAGARSGSIYIDMSTIAPRTAIKVAEALQARGVACLDAPVSGGDVGAREATLSIMVGGEQAVLDQVLPILQTMGKTITLCGPNGAGQIVKACNQVQVALTIAGMAEALVLGAKAGVDPAIIIKVLSAGFAQSRIMDVRGPRVIRGDFQPGFKSRFHYKDLNIIRQTGKDYGVPLPLTGLVTELFAALLADGKGDLDHTSLITVIEELANMQARTG